MRKKCGETPHCRNGSGWLKLVFVLVLVLKIKMQNKTVFRKHFLSEFSFSIQNKSSLLFKLEIKFKVIRLFQKIFLSDLPWK